MPSFREENTLSVAIKEAESVVAACALETRSGIIEVRPVRFTGRREHGTEIEISTAS